MKKSFLLIFSFFFLFSIFTFSVNFNSMTDLVKNSVAIFMCKYPGYGNKVKVVGTLKGSVPREIELGSSYLENMQPKTLYMVFAKHRDPWRIFSDGYVYLASDEVSGRVWKSPMNLEKLFKGIGPQVRAELYRIPAPIHKKTHHPVTIGNVLDEISHYPENSPIERGKFFPVMKALVKVASGERYGQANPNPSLPHIFNMSNSNNRKPSKFVGRVDKKFKREVKDITSCSGGTVLNIGDEDYAQINFTSFSFPYMGTTYTSCYVEDNGYITFGSAYNNYYIDLYSFFSYMPPIIAPFYNDFDPGEGGTISYVETANELIICWDELPDYSYPSYTCSFALHLYSDGSFMFEYGTMDVYWQGIMGFSDGASGLHSLSGDYDFSYLMDANYGIAEINGSYKNVFDDYSNDLDYIDYGLVFFSGNPTGDDPVNNLLGYDSMANAYELNTGSSPIPGWYQYTSPDGGHMSPGETIWYKVDVSGTPDENYLIKAKVTSYDAYDDFADTMIGVFNENGELIDLVNDIPGFWSFSYDPNIKLLVPGGSTYYICVTGTGDYGFSGNHSENGYIGVSISAIDWTGYPLPLGDDDYITISLPFDYPIAGYDWPVMYLCSNGFVSFDYPDTEYEESEDNLEQGPVRACMYWDDLAPEDANSPYGVYYWTDTSDPTFMYAGIQFYGVPTLGGVTTNFASFFINDGTFIEFINLTDTDGLVGYGIGNGIPVTGSTNLSSKINSTSVFDWGTGLKNLGTGFEPYYYELFDDNNPCDLGESGGFNEFQFFGMYNYNLMAKDPVNNTCAYFNYSLDPSKVRCKFLSLQKDYFFLSPTMSPVVAAFNGYYYFGVNDRMYPGYLQTKGKFDANGDCAVYLANYYFPEHLFKCITFENTKDKKVKLPKK